MIKVNSTLILTIIKKSLTPKTKICSLLLRQDPAQKFAKNVLSPIFWLLGSKFNKSQSRNWPEKIWKCTFGTPTRSMASFFLPIQTDCVVFQTSIAETLIYPLGV